MNFMMVQAGGNFGGDTTTHNILREGYYWPTLFRDAHAYARKCQECQKVAGREKKHHLSSSTCFN
jgi:hypothetical protein